MVSQALRARASAMAKNEMERVAIMRDEGVKGFMMRWVRELARDVWRSGCGGSGWRALNDGPVRKGTVDPEGACEEQEEQEEPA